MNAIPADPSSNLKVRAFSALVMVTVAGLAFFTGGPIFSLFIGTIALLAIREWWGLTLKIAASQLGQVVWLSGGIGYIGCAAYLLILMRSGRDTEIVALGLIGIVIATDVGAFFTGRTLGGPKIAPSISPSKTWSGLAGGMVAAGLFAVAVLVWLSNSVSAAQLAASALAGALLAVVAQTGDFFESWMKRRAGVKDSGSIIPGHGGVLDRVDGLIPVVIVGTGVLMTMVLQRGGL